MPIILLYHCSQINQPFMQHLSKHASSTAQKFHQLIAQHPYQIWITMLIYFNSFHRPYSKCQRQKWRLWIHYWDKMSLSCLNLFDHYVSANLRKWCEMNGYWTWGYLSWELWEIVSGSSDEFRMWNLEFLSGFYRVSNKFLDEF